MRNILFTALTKFLHHQKEHNPQLLIDYHNAFSSSTIDTFQALDGLAQLATELGIYCDSDSEMIRPEVLAYVGLNLKNNLDLLRLARYGEEITSRILTEFKEVNND